MKNIRHANVALRLLKEVSIIHLVQNTYMQLKCHTLIILIVSGLNIPALQY